MSLYADYRLEREGLHTIESELGFISYRINGVECYIEAIYVRPEYRLGGETDRLEAQVADIARKAGCKYLTGSVCIGMNGCDISLAILLKSGYRLLCTSGNLIYVKKELAEPSRQVG